MTFLLSFSAISRAPRPPPLSPQVFPADFERLLALAADLSPRVDVLVADSVKRKEEEAARKKAEKAKKKEDKGNQGNAEKKEDKGKKDVEHMHVP